MRKKNLVISKLFYLLLIQLNLILSACSTQPIVPSADKITISRENPPQECKNLGRVQGRTISASPNLEAAIEDMKKEVAFKGANYVVMETASGYETAVSGTAYYCP
ncbi:MAG: DUF4156 domain-containing protein [Deltaproteobacteria bacterium]|jgi:hypothetical protein|nr:DUF4156 domain-containing protein [Deltaproteobacteria bacterium]